MVEREADLRNEISLESFCFSLTKSLIITLKNLCSHLFVCRCFIIWGFGVLFLSNRPKQSTQYFECSFQEFIHLLATDTLLMDVFHFLSSKGRKCDPRKFSDIIRGKTEVKRNKTGT